MSQKRKRTAENELAVSTGEVHRSEPIEDRQSTFIGFFSPDIPARDLQRIAEVKSASHKILAWRKEGTQRSLTGSIAQYDVGNDDDGEKNGGKAVQRVLDQMKVVGSCVVARWYGGVMLGPVRFTHMEDCAKGAVRKWQESIVEAATKKRKLEDETVQAGKLTRSLEERDRSIGVLRTLAAEKEQMVEHALVLGMEELDHDSVEAGSSKAEPTPLAPAKAEVTVSPAKPALEYSYMPIDRLRALDKARDATLAFLLKRIEKAEADLAALGEAPKQP
ncbi:hypothetical protein LTR86_005285 [Recurvomyces mirabilis]|nr:hypothetical protein LTR86_005285 [Recurvomyces mirabilis]